MNLVEERLNRGFSIRGLARELDMSEQSIRRLESGGGGVRPATAKKLADFYGVRVTDLLPLAGEEAVA